MKKILGLIIIICGLGIGFFGIPSSIGDLSLDNAISKIKSGNEKAVTENLSDIAELSVLEYKYSNATSITDNKKVEQFKREFDLPFTKKTIVMTYDGDIKIGVNTEKITVDVSKSITGAVDKVVVGLPPMEITSNDLDRESIDYPLEKNAFLNDIDSDDYAKMEDEGKASMAEEVTSNGTMERAKKELQQTLTDYLKALYGDDITVTFKEVNS